MRELMVQCTGNGVQGNVIITSRKFVSPYHVFCDPFSRFYLALRTLRLSHNPRLSFKSHLLIFFRNSDQIRFLRRQRFYLIRIHVKRRNYSGFNHIPGCIQALSDP